MVPRFSDFLVNWYFEFVVGHPVYRGYKYCLQPTGYYPFILKQVNYIYFIWLNIIWYKIFTNNKCRTFYFLRFVTQRENSSNISKSTWASLKSTYTSNWFYYIRLNLFHKISLRLMMKAYWQHISKRMYNIQLNDYTLLQFDA